MIAKLVSFVVGLGALVVAAGVLIVSASFGIYALLRTYVGPAGAAGCVTFLAAVLIGILALLLFSKAKGPKSKPKSAASATSGNLVEKLTGLVSDRPIIAAGAAVAAGLLAWRNPTLVATLLRISDLQGSRDRR